MKPVASGCRLGSRENPVKVLYLDNMDNSALGLLFAEWGICAEFTFEPDSVGAQSGYRASREIIDLAGQTASGAFHFVVIHHNCGAGLEKAGAIAPEMRADRSIIFWNHKSPQDESRYAELGYRHFFTGRPTGKLERDFAAFFHPHFKES